tara:strand:+ start:136 stop:252 length:117 start_codon:yes stop_codon:yes gene_type:complete
MNKVLKIKKEKGSIESVVEESSLDFKNIELVGIIILIK